MSATLKLKEQGRKPSLVVPSGELDNREGGEETEIAAAITIAPDGGWGWVVTAAAFGTLFIIDGITLSFGPLLPDVCKDFDISTAQGALVNSLLLATYLLCCPIASALINRFGFRTIGMAGAIICSLSMFAAYYATYYQILILMYSIGTGFGSALAIMSATVIVGFYFEKLRFIVMPIVSCGTSVGTMVMYPIFVKTVAMGGWRPTVLLQASFLGMIYFFCLTFRPLTSFTIVATDEGSPMRTVTFLPTMTKVRSQASNRVQPSTTERAIGAISNAHFPTAAKLVDSTRYAPTPAGLGTGTSTTAQARVSKIKIKALNAAPNDQLRVVKSIMSTKSFKEATQQFEFTMEVQEKPRKKSCFGRLFDWQSHPEEARPMYRDDVFYDGKIDKLPAYQKITKDFPEEQRTGLEYQLEVSRAVAVDDLKERRGVCTTAVRRILVTMLNLNLLKKTSFMVFCLSTLLMSSGSVVPYVFLQARALANGMDPDHSAMLVSVLSIFNLIGRLASMALAKKIPAVYILMIGMIISGISTIFSSLSYTPVYQYSYSAVYGIGVAMGTCLRPVAVVDNYGLENLTNGYGVLLMFNGIASLYCTPLCAFFVGKFGYSVAFYICGSFMVLGAFAIFLVKMLRPREKKREEHEKLPSQATTLVTTSH